MQDALRRKVRRMSASPLFPVVEPWISVEGELCENPLWDERTQTLYWCDIPRGRVYAKGWEDSGARLVYEGGIVGGFTFEDDGALLLFRERDVTRLERDGSASLVRTFNEPGNKRFNDVIADPAGRVFAGTIGETSESGGLYRFDLDGGMERVAGGTGCSNGMGFSPDLRTFYWTCSTRRRIFAYPYDAGSGELGAPRVLFENEEGDGVPDGMTVDAAGNLLVARWGAREFGLLVLTPDGTVTHRIRTGAKCTTAPAFCGPELRDLALTSAASSDDPARAADLFLVKELPVAGRAEFRSKLA